MNRTETRQAARAAAREAATERTNNALMDFAADNCYEATPNRAGRRRKPAPPRGTNVERQNRSDARPKNARKLKVRAQREAQRIQRGRADRYGAV